jgi:hypothetical protein
MLWRPVFLTRKATRSSKNHLRNTYAGIGCVNLIEDQRQYHELILIS